ncbi:hypothetical protein Tco_1443897 [Tanacetum coccineum]
MELLLSCLGTLKKGEPVDIPSYDYKIHKNSGPGQMGHNDCRKKMWCESSARPGLLQNYTIGADIGPQDIICIEMGKSDDDAVKKKVSIVSAVCNGNLNVLKVYGVKICQKLYEVSTECCRLV